jgi:hypothetical protein
MARLHPVQRLRRKMRSQEQFEPLIRMTGSPSDRALCVSHSSSQPRSADGAAKYAHDNGRGVYELVGWIVGLSESLTKFGYISITYVGNWRREFRHPVLTLGARSDHGRREARRKTIGKYICESGGIELNSFRPGLKAATAARRRRRNICGSTTRSAQSAPGRAAVRGLVAGRSARPERVLSIARPLATTGPIGSGRLRGRGKARGLRLQT